jgi:hypothetical protein
VLTYRILMLGSDVKNIIKNLGSALFLTLIACGTVHQFMPPQPLRPNEFRCTLTLSYDSNLFAPFGNWGSSFYWGAGQDINIGFGFQPPVGVSHLTAIKYFNPEKSVYSRLYGSFDDLTLSIDSSPDMEIGASLINHSGTAYHAFSMGMWGFFRESIANSYARTFWAAKAKQLSSLSLGPSLKYEFTNNDFTLSILNYEGMTRKAVEAERHKIENRKRIILPNDDIESLDFDFNTRRIEIIMKNKEKIRITPQMPYPDMLAPDIEKWRLERFNPMGNWGYYFVHTSDGLKLYELDFSAVISDYAGKNDIVLGSFPPRKKDILNMIKWYKHDWSIGLGMKL